MKSFLIELSKILGGYITVTLSYFLGLDNPILILLILAVVDYITGVIAAFVNKKIDSHIGFKGIAKKVAMFLLVGVANIIGKEFGVDLRIIVISFYIANEAISITENSAKLGLPIPKKLLDVLEQLKGKGEEDVTDK